MYECPICQSINHDSRLQCQNCGTIPAKYSWRKMPINQHNTQVVIAYGSLRAAQHHLARVNLRTMSVDYYAEV